MKTKHVFYLLAAVALQAPANAATQADSGWFIRIIAESPAEGLVDRSNVLGQASTALAGFDRYDLPEMAPIGTPYLSVVFQQDGWNEKAGDYNSDFKPLTQSNPTWTFTVKSDDPNREVTLKWEGEKYLDKMVMVDVLTGEEFYPVIGGKAQAYTFNMGGVTERDFLWKY